MHLCGSYQLMSRIQHALRALLFISASMLVLNDVVRLVFSFIPGSFLTIQIDLSEQEEENNPVNPFSIFEEEVKHKECYPTFLFQILDGTGLEVSIAHIIKDDEVRHLAYLAIFSPPPDLA